MKISQPCLGLALTTLLIGMPLAAAPSGAKAGADKSAAVESNDLWLSAGYDVRNTRHATRESVLNAGNVSKLAQKWVFKADGLVLPTPAVDEQAVYFADSGGTFHKLNRDTGAVIWKRSIPAYTGGSGQDKRGSPWSRTTPAIAGNMLVIGTRDAFILALDKNSGELIWKTKVESHPAAIITASPVLDRNSGRVYVGVSSFEEQLAAQPDYVCCTFRGSTQALDLKTGKVLWKTHTVPEGYSGGSVVGSTPAIDYKRGSLYVTTSNNYTVPPEVAECAVKAGKDQRALAGCTAATDYFDSILSLDLKTGAVKWGAKVWPYDAWSYACMTPGRCKPESPDYGFMSGANLYTTVAAPGRPARDLVGAGQKSGIYWALDPDSGRVVWKTQVGPGGFIGGVQWGSAVDGQRVYVSISNWSPAKSESVRLKSGQTIDWGFYSALDAASGEVLWQTADPTPKSHPIGMVTIANGVMFAGSFDKEGTYYALDARNGSVLWKFPSGGAVVSGAAVVNGSVYWGSGFAGGVNDKIYAFALPRN